MQQVTVRAFKGKPYVDLREFYEKEGELMPGKKGVSVTVYSVLKASLGKSGAFRAAMLLACRHPADASAVGGCHRKRCSSGGGTGWYSSRFWH